MDKVSHSEGNLISKFDFGEREREIVWCIAK